MEQLLLPSSSSSKWTYDVFLSFRGEDTRRGFTGNLYNALQKRGINTFLDDEALRRGEDISQALLKSIDESRIVIIVFSKSYASSKWCLNELVKIMESFRANKCKVYPVFYKVDPTDVRHQTGSYEQGLATLEGKLEDNKEKPLDSLQWINPMQWMQWGYRLLMNLIYFSSMVDMPTAEKPSSKEKVQNWRLALREAADLAGWHFTDGCGYEYEYEFIKKIIDRVSRDLDHHHFHVADYPVGLESRVSEVLLRLDINVPDVRMVGLCGIGGIGKTTLARALCNSIHDQFEGLCFLSDVRENSIKHDLVHLQKKILSDILGERKIKLGDVYRGIPILMRRLEHKRVLLVLDDVDKLEQLEKLAGGRNWFGSGSRIIITTRRRDILATHGVESIYYVPKLSHDEALELVRQKASKRPNPDACYMAVWNRAILYSHGLPLVLNIIGSDLLGRPTDEWESTLDRYQQVPNEEILRALKVSYDSLDELEKRIFLDIACFFTGEPLPYVEDILSACGFHPKYGIRILRDRSLLSITECGRLMMHDLIKDMGVEIVRQESPLPGKRSRLWFYKDVLQVFKENVGTDKIEGIMLDFVPRGQEIEQLSDTAFNKMKNLRILIIKNASFSRVPKYLPNSLSVLEWRGYPAGSLPHDFQPTNLAVVKLPSSGLLTLDKFKNMECLTRMDFTACEFLSEVPDVSGVPNLKSLYLDDCVSLIKIHESVGSLSHLEKLTARGCINLATIPFAFKLPSLRLLSFSECPRLVRFPEILCKIENLRELDLCETAIEELPSSIRNLIGLEYLYLNGCGRLVKLPSSIFMSPRLQEIRADPSGGVGISNECEGHGQLQLTVSASKIHLYLSSCNLTDEFLVECLTGFANLVTLILRSNNFTVLPACIKECIHLRTLHLTNCKQLRDIFVIPPKLEVIVAFDCTSLTSKSSSVLLSHVSSLAFHEMGNKTVVLPGSTIPEWFDHYSRERSTIFWVRGKFPRICVYAVAGMPAYSLDFQVSVSMLINGMRRIPYGSFRSWPTVTEHVWLFDLSALLNDSDLTGTFSEYDWNTVEILLTNWQGKHEYSKAQITHWPPTGAMVNEYGIHVYKQESRMENISFTNPKTPQESNGNFERFNEGNCMIAQSRDDGAFHGERLVCSVPTLQTRCSGERTVRFAPLAFL